MMNVCQAKQIETHFKSQEDLIYDLNEADTQAKPEPQGTCRKRDSFCVQGTSDSVIAHPRKVTKTKP